MKTGVFLSKAESFRFQIINKFLNGDIKRSEAATLLKLSERSVSRIATKVRQKGFWGVKNGNIGRTVAHAYPMEVKQLVLELFLEKYFDFNAAHFTEILEKKHGLEISHTTVWRWLKSVKLVKKSRKHRRIKRIYRDRMPQAGLLLQMDGSHHKWNGQDDWCLISAIDDATSEIPYAEFFIGETTVGCMKVLKRIIELKGVPKAIYTDRAGWTGGQKRTEFSQFQNACEKLGIQIIFADSPEAKGRIERSFRTFQDRLIPELRAAEANTMEKANEYLNEKFLAKYWNVENTVKPMNEEIAYSPLDPWLDLEQVLSIEERRVISNDHTVSWKGKRWRLNSGKFNFSGFEAVFRTNLEGKTSIFVMENEVSISEIKVDRPIEEATEPPKKTINPRLYPYMYRTVTALRNQVVMHMVTGKPLNLGKLKKKTVA